MMIQVMSKHAISYQHTLLSSASSTPCTAVVYAKDINGRAIVIELQSAHAYAMLRVGCMYAVRDFRYGQTLRDASSHVVLIVDASSMFFVILLPRFIFHR